LAMFFLKLKSSTSYQNHNGRGPHLESAGGVQEVQRGAIHDSEATRRKPTGTNYQKE
jgi:hypothetical protein